jgi:hypothetical protein
MSAAEAIAGQIPQCHTAIRHALGQERMTVSNAHRAGATPGPPHRIARRLSRRAVAGTTFALVDQKFQPDAAAAIVRPGLSAADVTSPFLNRFPYLGLPYDGFTHPS